MKKKNPIDEARRYMENAKTLLVEHGDLDEDDFFYNNRKCVKKVGNALWRSVLLVLDAVFHVRQDRRTRVHIDDYLEAIGNRDEKLCRIVDSGYEVLYVIMGYYGNQCKGICEDGFRIANDIIDRCAVMLN